MPKKYKILLLSMALILLNACTKNIKISTQTPICGKDTLYNSIYGYVEENSGIDSILINTKMSHKILNSSIGLDYNFEIKEGDSITICNNGTRTIVKDFHFKYPNFILEKRSESQLNFKYVCKLLYWE